MCFKKNQKVGKKMARQSQKTVKKEEKVVETKPIEVESPLRTGMSDTTKGLIIGVLITALIAVMVILLVIAKNDDKETSGGNNVNIGDPSTYSDALNEFYDYFESSEKTLIVFASSQCGYCIAQEPIVVTLAEKYGFNYLYMDYLELASNDEVNLVISELQLEKGSTPTSVVVQKGEVIKTWVGFVDGKTYVNNLVDAGVLPKNTKYDLEDSINSINYTKFQSLLKGSKVSAILVDMPTCSICYSERIEANRLAKKYGFDMYQLSAESLSEDEMNEFIDGLGDWGYDDAEYVESGQVAVPLLLFVKNGKIVDYKVGYTEDDNIEATFKSNGLIK